MASQKQLDAARKEFNARKAEKAAATRAANKADRERKIKEQRVLEEQLARVQANQPGAMHVNVEDLMAQFDGISTTRVIIGFVLALASSFTVGYGIGMLMSYALAGIMTLTGTAWIAFTLSVIVWVLGLYSAWKIGGYVGG